MLYLRVFVLFPSVHAPQPEKGGRKKNTTSDIQAGGYYLPNVIRNYPPLAEAHAPCAPNRDPYMPELSKLGLIERFI